MVIVALKPSVWLARGKGNHMHASVYGKKFKHLRRWQGTPCL